MNTPLSFNQYLTAWKYHVVGKTAVQLPPELIASDLQEFQNWQRQLAQAKIDANNAGHTCNFNKGGTPSGRCAAWVVANGHTLKIVFNAKAKRPQAVTQTSREAYKTVDLGERCEAVARAAIKLGVCTDNEVGREIGMPANLVSGRRNNIEDAGGITIDGIIYVVKMSGVAKRDEITKRSGNVWFLQEAFEGVRPNERAVLSVSTSLFQ